MIEFYVVGAVVIVIVGLVSALKIQAKAHAATKVKLQVAEANVASANIAIVQTAKTDEAVQTVKVKQNVSQQAEQVKIDAGIRDDFSGDFNNGC